MNELFYFCFYAFLIASFSFVYIIILLDSDGVLAWLYRLLNPIMEKNIILRFIKRPLLDCVHCNAGQISLWFYLIKYRNFEYNILWHISFVVLSILISQILIVKYGKK